MRGRQVTGLEGVTTDSGGIESAHTVRPITMKKVIASLIGCLMITGCVASKPGAPGGTTVEATAPLPADQLVFAVDFSGMSDYQAYVADATGLAIYGDGRVYRLIDTKAGQRVAATYEIGQLDPMDVAEFAATATQSGLLEPDTGYGEVHGVEDAGGIAVTLHDKGEPLRVSVYAPDSDSGVTLTQGRNRKKLLELADAAKQLADTAQFAPATIDHVQVVQTRPWNTTAPEWPGPDPATFLAPITGSSFGLGCGTLSGSEAAKVLAAAAQNDSTYHWMVNGQPTVLVVRPLLPGEEACDKVT